MLVRNQISSHRNSTLCNPEIIIFRDSQIADYQYSFSCKNLTINTNKEKDSLRLNPQSGELCGARLTSPPDLLTSFYYFGARYYDCDLSGLFLSVDPMSDKYPSLSPYAYCAWNPIKLVDPDGRDWDLIVNEEEKTVTIKAQYAVMDGDEKARKSAEIAIGKWNVLSGKYSLMSGNDKYTVLFDLSVINMSEYDDKNTSHNTYKLVAGFYDNNELGETTQRHISILESEKYNSTTSSHEIGHSLGLLHNVGSSGLMEEDGGRQSGNHSITRNNILDIIEFSFHPERRNSEYASGIGHLVPQNYSLDLSNRRNTKLLNNK